METLTYTLPIENAESLLPLPIPLPGRTKIQFWEPALATASGINICRILIVEVDSWKHSG